LRKGSVRAATTTAGTLGTSFANGQVIDGVTLATGNLILIKNQSSAAENGVYTVNASGAPTRATWMDAASEIDGVYVAVEDGTTNVGTLWITVSEVTTLDTDPITFTQIQTAGTIDGSGAANKVAYWSDPDTLTSTTNFHFNGTQLAVGTASPIASTVMTLKGTGTSSSTFPLKIVNSADTAILSVQDDGYLSIGSVGPILINQDGFQSTGDIRYITTNNTTYHNFEFGYLNSALRVTDNLSTKTDASFIVRTLTPKTFTSGTGLSAQITGTFSPSSGTATQSFLEISPTVNQTGGANGIVRGLHVLPTITAAADFRGVEITANSSHYALYTTAGKVRFDLGSDAQGDLLTRGSGGNLERIAAGTSGYALISNGAGTAPTWQAISSGTVTRAFVEGSTSSTIDLDANTGVVKDVDGTNVAFTAPTDKNKFFVYRNGQKISETGTLTTRDYSINTTTHVLTLSRALDASEILEVVKFA
jgi:hypothetical protein